MSLHNLKKTFAAHCVHKLISQILGMAGSAITTSFIKKPTKNWMIFYLILLCTTYYYYTPRPSNCHFELHSEKKFAFLKKKNENIMGLCVTNYVTTLKQNVGLLAMLYKILYYPTTKYYTTHHHDIYYYL